MLDYSAIAGPDIRTVDSTALQAAVASKLLQQVEAAFTVHATNAAHENLMDAFTTFLQLPEGRRLRILLHPTFRYWLQSLRRAGTEHDLAITVMRKLPEFTRSEQFLAGQLAHVWSLATDRQGGLRCPSLGRFIELGSHYADQWVQVWAETDAAVIHCKDGLTIRIPPEDLEGPALQPPPSIAENGYCLTVCPLVAEGRVEASNRDPWLRVRLTGTNQRTTGTEFLGTDDDLYPDTPPLEPIEEALALLNRCWPAAHADFSEFTRVIVPIASITKLSAKDSDSTNQALNQFYRAFTVSSRQGAIYIGPAPARPTVEMLIHEFAHVKLRQIQALDPILTDPLDESSRFFVPWRSDPRPIPGILEGLFVFSHVAEFEYHELAAGLAADGPQRLIQRLDHLRCAASILEQHAATTTEGKKFLSAMRQWTNSLENRATT